jgi:hypothetical protein
VSYPQNKLDDAASLKACVEMIADGLRPLPTAFKAKCSVRFR